MNKRLIVIVIVVLIPALIACGDAINPTPAATAVPYIEPAFGSQLADGQALFGQYCAGCHGQNGEGLGPFPALNSAQHAYAHPDWEFIALIKQGRNGMPPFADKLSDEQITLIISRIKAWWDPGKQSEQRELCLLYPAPTPTPD